MRPLFEPFGEYERLARNRPHPAIDKAYPKVTDGTLSSIIEKTPRRIIQQIPTGKVECIGYDDWLPIMAQWILDNEILPNANSQYALIQKCWAVVEKGLTYGSQPSLDIFTKVDDKPTTDFKVPYVKDVFYEAGKLSDIDSNFKFIRAWYQKRDLEAIIAQQSKAVDGGVETDWNLEVLREIKDSITQKDDLSTTPNEKDKNNRSGGVELIHCFQKGVKAKFFTIHIKTKKIARTKVNKDPRGVMPGNTFYAGTDMSNPVGRGFPERVGAMQNLLDAEVQMYQYNRALMLNPPMVKRGNWNKNQAKLAPNVLVDLGSDPKATWEPVKIDSVSLSTFPNNYGLMKSQILNLLSSPDTSISADVGNPGFSKTDAGVKSQQAVLSVDDNYIRKNFEAWFERECETLINLYFGERTGVEEFQVDEATAIKLRACDPSVVNEDGKVRIDFTSETPKLKFTVDASSSNMKDNQQQTDILDSLLERYEKAPTLQQLVPPEKITAVWNSIVTASGVEDPEDLMVEQEKDEQGNVIPAQPQEQASQLQPEQVQQMIQDAIKQNDANDISNHPIVKLMTSLNIKFTDLPEDSKHEVLNIIGVPSQMASPTQNDTALKAINQAHTIVTGHEQQQNQQAQLDQTAQQNQAQNQLQVSQQVQDTQQQQSQTDAEHMKQLTDMGLSPDQAQQALALIDRGYPLEDVMKMIGAPA